MTIKNVTIGDKFKNRKQECEVVDFLEERSMATGQVVGYQCIVKQVTGIAQNAFQVPFATVIRYRIN